MKFLVFSLLSVFCIQSQAARDSVAVFHRPEKVVVQINEEGSAGRLQRLFEAWGADETLYWESADGSFYIDCGRRVDAATCLIRLLPSEFVQIAQTQSRAIFQMPSDLALGDLDISFESSRRQKARLILHKHSIEFTTEKPRYRDEK